MNCTRARLQLKILETRMHILKTLGVVKSISDDCLLFDTLSKEKQKDILNMCRDLTEMSFYLGDLINGIQYPSPI